MMSLLRPEGRCAPALGFRIVRMGLLETSRMKVQHSVLALTILSVSTTIVAEEIRPNVVILFVDDLGMLDANCYGSTDLKTPHIDKLAATGVRFTQAYAHTVCCPARAALLTGRYPQRGGVHYWTQADMDGEVGINMALEEVTLAEVLKTAGYRTALLGKWHLGAHRDFGPKKQGFDEFLGIRGGFIDNYKHYALHGDGFYDLYEGTEKVHADGEYFPELMVRRALQFVDENKGRPFFLSVAYNIPHYPEQPLKQYAAVYKDMTDPARRSYAAAISTVDHYIGQIVAALDALELREQTIVIFMGDNGHSVETKYRIKYEQPPERLCAATFLRSQRCREHWKMDRTQREFLRRRPPRSHHCELSVQAASGRDP